MLKPIATLLAAATLCLSTGSLAQDQKSNSQPPASKASNPAPSATGSSGIYTVKDGTKVDAKTLAGWKTWRALACDRCHGPAQEGLVGPSLVESLKKLSKDEFHKIMLNGRPEKGMPNFSGSQMVVDNWEGLYAYLKGRSDGQIQPGRLTGIDSK
jgi:mono/diheme cytochrome c family protein